MLTKIKINNYPDYADEYVYIVVRLVDNEFWFYGAYDTPNFSNKVAAELGNAAVIERYEDDDE